MKNKTRKNLVWMIFLISILSVGFVQSLEFYSGEVYIKSLDTKIEINDNVDVVLTYVFSGGDNVDLNFVGVPNEAVITIDGESYSKEFKFDFNGEKEIVVNYVLEAKGDVRSITYNPKVLFDGKVNSKKVLTHLIEISAPSYLKDFSMVSENYDLRILGGRNVFRWENNNEYLTSLIFKWNNLGYDVSAERELKKRDGFLDVVVVLKNNGVVAENLVLENILMAEYFPVYLPKEDFEYKKYETGDALVWRKEIPLLLVEEEKKFNYTLVLNSNLERVVLDSLDVSVNGIVISSTDKQIIVNTAQSSLSDSIEKMTAYAVQNDELSNNSSLIKIFFGKNLSSILIILSLIVLSVAIFFIIKFLRKKSVDIEGEDFVKSNDSLGVNLGAYIRDGLKKGYSRKLLKKVLLKSGWQEEKINKEMENIK